jgi:radical SAM-linked protein
MRLRVKFEKRGAIRFCSHKDVVRIFQRCFAARGIPVSYSTGFRPHMRMSFAPPLKTGWEGCDEYMDIITDGPAGDLARTCNDFLPDGLRVVQVGDLAAEVPKLANDIRAARMSVRVHKADIPQTDSSPAGEAGFGAVLTKYRDDITRRFTGYGGSDGTNGKLPEIIAVHIEDGDETICIEYTSTMLSGKIVGPDRLVAAAIGDPAAFRFPLRVTRRAQYVVRNGEHLSPISQGVIRNEL